jgi:hypothetical protein
MTTQLDTSKEPIATSQNGFVLRHLRSGKRITAYEAMQFYGIYRLAARINDLRNKGHAIKSEDVRDGLRHWAVYWMEAEELTTNKVTP